MLKRGDAKGDCSLCGIAKEGRPKKRTVFCCHVRFSEKRTDLGGLSQKKCPRWVQACKMFPNNNHDKPVLLNISVHDFRSTDLATLPSSSSSSFSLSLCSGIFRYWSRVAGQVLRPWPRRIGSPRSSRELGIRVPTFFFGLF